MSEQLVESRSDRHLHQSSGAVQLHEMCVYNIRVIWDRDSITTCINHAVAVYRFQFSVLILLHCVLLRPAVRPYVAVYRFKSSAKHRMYTVNKGNGFFFFFTRGTRIDTTIATKKTIRPTPIAPPKRGERKVLTEK